MDSGQADRGMVSHQRYYGRMKMTIDDALPLERSTREVAKSMDAEGFLEIVSPEAVMISGGVII